MKSTLINFKGTMFTLTLATAFLISTAAHAQEKEKEMREKQKSEMKDDSKKMNWEDYKNDLKAKYRTVVDQVDKMQSQATEKVKTSPEFKEELDKFQARSKEFGERLRNSDELAADKQEEFRKNMKEELAKLNHAYDDLRERWEKMNK